MDCVMMPSSNFLPQQHHTPSPSPSDAATPDEPSTSSNTTTGTGSGEEDHGTPVIGASTNGQSTPRSAREQKKEEGERCRVAEKAERRRDNEEEDARERIQRGEVREGSGGDRSHIYTNLVEMAQINNRPEPPAPDVADRPLRNLHNGWQEYQTEAGRSYFFHAETGRSQWNPPRFLRSPAQVQAFLAANGGGKEEERASETTRGGGGERASDTPRGGGGERASETPRGGGGERASETPRGGGGERASETPRGGERITEISSERSHSEAPEKKPARVSYFDGGHAKSDLMTTSFTSLRDRRSSLKHVAVPKIASAVVPVEGTVAPKSTVSSSLEETRGCEKLSLPQSTLPLETPPAEPPPFPPQPLPQTPKMFSATCLEHVSPESNYAAEQVTMRTIRSGNMEKSYDAAKKKEWAPAFMYLSSAHLIIYKDEKSAEKHGKHYAAPLGVCDLKGAEITWMENAKEKKKRRVIDLTLSTGSKVFLRTASEAETEEWHDALRDVIRKLPAGSGVGLLDHSSALVRTPSMAASRVGPMTESVVETERPSRESVLERLKRFFRSRPSVETLKEKGIYKHEAVFGSTLASICQQDGSLVPKFIRTVTELIEAKGLETDGIYRVSGNLSSIQKIRCQVDQDKYSLLVSESDVHVLSGTLKLFFRELAESIFPPAQTKQFLTASKLTGKQRLKRFDELLKELPAENRETLKFLFRHLHRVASHSKQNRMQVHNLAIVFGPTLLTNEETRGVSSKKKEEKGKNKSGSSSTATSSSRKGGASASSAHHDDAPPPAAIQSNSILAYNLIMQGQIVEVLLNEMAKLDSLKGPIQLTQLTNC